jgi:hypothetical protein
VIASAEITPSSAPTSSEASAAAPTSVRTSTYASTWDLTRRGPLGGGRLRAPARRVGPPPLETEIRAHGPGRVVAATPAARDPGWTCRRRGTGRRWGATVAAVGVQARRHRARPHLGISSGDQIPVRAPHRRQAALDRRRRQPRPAVGPHHVLAPDLGRSSAWSHTSLLRRVPANVEAEQISQADDPNQRGPRNDGKMAKPPAEHYLGRLLRVDVGSGGLRITCHPPGYR